MRDDIENRVIKILKTHLNIDKNIEIDTPLMELGIGVDSVSTLELVVMIENEFDIVIDESSITPEVFFTPAAIAEFIKRHI